MRTLALFATVAALMAQPKYSEYRVIPTTTDSATGTIKWLEKRANGTNSFAWAAPDTLAADVIMKWPTDGVTGYLFSDGAGNTSWQAAGTGCLGCMDLTTNQTASGIKTFSNGIIMQGTSTAQNLNVLPTYTLDVGTPGAINIAMQAGLASWTNGSGIQRVLISQGGGASTVSGIVRTLNATDTINSLDSNGVFSGVGFSVGTFASPIPIVDAAGLVTPVSFQLTTGATNGYVLTSDSLGNATWQPGAAGGSYITTNTAQTGMTGDKETTGNWTWGNPGATGVVITSSGSANFYNSAGISKVLISNAGSGPTTSGIVRTFDNAGTLTNGMDNTGVSTRVGFLAYDAAFGAYWVTKYGSVSNSLETYSGSGGQLELQTVVTSSTNSQWLFRGTLAPIVAPSGSNGDIGQVGNPWRAAYFSGAVNANAGVFSGSSPYVNIGGQFAASATNLIGYDTGLSVNKIFLSWSGSGGGIMRTFSNTGTEQNSIDGVDGVRSNVGFSVGTAGSPTQIITNTGAATFPSLRIPPGAVNGYVLTSDASGNATWQASASGSFVTTNTNQPGLSGTKEWTNLHTFNGGVEVKLASTSRNWNPESDAAYVLGSGAARWLSANFSSSAIIGDGGTGARLELFSATGGYYSASNVQKVLFAAGGSGTGIVRVFNSSGVIQAGMDSTGFDTPNAYSVSGTQVITSGRTGLFPQIGQTTNHVIDFYGETVNVYGSGLTSVCGGGQMFATGLNWYTTIGLGCSSVITASVAGASGVLNVSGSITTNTFRVITGAVSGYVLTSDGSGNATWQAAGAGSNITTNTSQSGLTGDKQTSGTWTWGTSGGRSIVAAGNGNNLSIYNTSNVLRSFMSDQGIIRTFNASGVQVNSMDSSGLSTTLGIVVNGSGGLSLTCAAGQTVRQPVYVFGVLTSGVCGI
jgi:hypothetical protein